MFEFLNGQRSPRFRHRDALRSRRGTIAIIPERRRVIAIIAKWRRVISIIAEWRGSISIVAEWRRTEATIVAIIAVAATEGFVREATVIAIAARALQEELARLRIAARPPHVHQIGRAHV